MRSSRTAAPILSLSSSSSDREDRDDIDYAAAAAAGCSDGDGDGGDENPLYHRDNVGLGTVRTRSKSCCNKYSCYKPSAIPYLY